MRSMVEGARAVENIPKRQTKRRVRRPSHRGSARAPLPAIEGRDEETRRTDCALFLQRAFERPAAEKDRDAGDCGDGGDHQEELHRLHPAPETAEVAGEEAADEIGREP